MTMNDATIEKILKGTTTYNDMRDYIDVVDSSTGQICAYLEGQLGQGLYKILIDQWKDLTPRLAQWAWEQVMYYKTENKVFTVDLYAKGLQYGITTAWQLKDLLELDINDKLLHPKDTVNDFFSIEDVIVLANEDLKS